MSGSVSEDWKSDGLDASVTLKVPWASRYLVVADVLYGRRAWPANAYCIASGAGIKPFEAAVFAGGDGQTAAYAYALVTLKYSTKEPEDEDLITEELAPNVEFITLDHKRFRWGSATGDTLEENEAPGRQQFSLALTRTYHKVIPPLPAGVLTHIGEINSSSYDSDLLGLTFAAKTLLFMPSSLSRTISLTGVPAVDVKLAFAYLPHEWNKFWRAKSQAYESIFEVKSAAIYKSYPEGDFSDLLY